MKQNLLALPNLDSLSNNSTKSHIITELTPPLDVILVHHNGQHYAYIDQCPHFGVCLNWRPDQYYNNEQKYIQCSTHGALFQIDNGLCIYGPCHGESLKSIPLIKKDEKYYVDTSLLSTPS